MGSGSKSTPSFGEATKQFCDAGIPARVLLPIVPVDAKVADTKRGDELLKNVGKAPGRYYKRQGQWGGLGKDNAEPPQMYVAAGVRDEADRAEFATWPTPNVGILGRFAPAIDSDAENEDARRLVEAVMAEVFGREAGYAERLRGNGPRRLYAFKAADLKDPERIVRSRHVHYRLKGEEDGDKVHKIDIIGAGNQYLIAGEHKSGDFYEWHPDYDLCELFRENLIQEIDNADIARFLETFEFMLEEAGGHVVHSSGGFAPGAERDYSDQPPIMDVKFIFDGLQGIPNDETNFASREDFVFALSAIRAALGAEAEENREHVEAWATAEGWADAEYFDKVWTSLERAVRVDRNALDRLFKRHGVFVSAAAEFQGDVAVMSAEIKKDQRARREAQDELLGKVMGRFVFGRVNTATDDGVLRMRRTFDVAVEFKGLDWWQFKTDDPEVALIEELHDCGRYDHKETGFWNFVRDMRKGFPHVFYTGLTRHPGHARGEIVEEDNPDGSVTRELNMRYQSPVILAAGSPPKNPKQAREDLSLLLDFTHRIFGEHADYELDTLAYMAQTTKRPGHMLFLVGEKGMGKSIYTNMLVSMFDGIGKDMGGAIDGTKLMSEASRRFVMAKIEGCRIISVKELPDGTTPANMAAVTSVLKQMVDPGPDGDYIQIEAKFKDGASIQNFARIVSTSNYQNAILVEENDRRIFYVSCGITSDNRPGGDFYGDVTAITKSPSRLATFWRYLLERDISRYEVAKAPPVSLAKQEAELAGLTNPVDRHFMAALECLRRAKRSIFDAQELAEVMTAMSENEHRNTQGAVDERKEYDFSGGGASLSVGKRLTRFTVRVASLKSDGARLPTIYGFKTARKVTDKLASASRNAILDALDDDRGRNPLSADHPWAVYAGPTRPGKRQR
jgi:hypothetical protein